MSDADDAARAVLRAAEQVVAEARSLLSQPGVTGCVFTAAPGSPPLAAVNVDDVFHNEEPGWIELHGRVRLDGLRIHRDASGMLFVGTVPDPDTVDRG